MLLEKICKLACTLNSNIINSKEWKYHSSHIGRENLYFSSINDGNFTELYVELSCSQYSYITFYIPKEFSKKGSYTFKMMRNGWYLSDADNGQCAFTVTTDDIALISFHLNTEDKTSETGWTVWYR